MGGSSFVAQKTPETLERRHVERRKSQPDEWPTVPRCRSVGEAAVDAVRREIREELRAEISNPVRIGVLENIFMCAGQPGHELVVVFDAELTDSSFYHERTLPLFEEVWGGAAFWLDLAEPLPGPLYPHGHSTLLEATV